MEFKKLSISEEKFEINLKFYFFLKHLVKTKFSENQAHKLLSIILETIDNHTLALSRINEYSETINSKSKQEQFDLLLTYIHTDLDIKLFLFSLHLYLIKDLLLHEAKLKEISNKHLLAKLDPLSLKYDQVSLNTPYSARVNGSLLSLLFFEKIESGDTNFLSADTDDFIKQLIEDHAFLQKAGLEPNQIFMLMFSESINQSIISDSGTNYEDRIKNTLIKLGVPKDSITKNHDKDDKSTEFDFFFELGNRTYGIGAKKTLRERYKQFIKTSLTSKLDVMIEITLGLDLNVEKAKTILKHGTILFVADEIYQSRLFLQELNGVYSVKDLSLKTLKSL